jgi:hypothetical protein
LVISVDAEAGMNVLRYQPAARFLCCAGAALLACLAVWGCKGGPAGQTEPTGLTGKVTYNGNPVTGGVLKFYFPNMANNQPVSRTPIKEDGSYSTKGIPVGKLKVVVDTAVVKAVEEQRGRMAAQPPPKPIKDAPAPPSGGMMPRSMGIYVEIPAKYTSPKRTPLSVEIHEGDQTKDFNLND